MEGLVSGFAFAPAQENLAQNRATLGCGTPRIFRPSFLPFASWLPGVLALTAVFRLIRRLDPPPGCLHLGRDRRDRTVRTDRRRGEGLLWRVVAGLALAWDTGVASVLLPCASLVHPLCIRGCNVKAGVDRATCPAGSRGTISFVSLSKSSQPSRCWRVTMKMRWPGGVRRSGQHRGR